VTLQEKSVVDVKSRVLAAATAVLCLQCGAAAIASEQIDYRAQIDAANRKVHETLAKRDAAAIAALYTIDAMVLPPRQESVRGRDEIRNFWQASLAGGGDAEMTIATVEVEGRGDTAFEVGTYVFSGKDGKILDHGKFVVIWKLVDGAWKVHRDIYNSSVPPPVVQETGK
jgi:uncharacterized protein (TIGR02246 family)